MATGSKNSPRRVPRKLREWLDNARKRGITSFRESLRKVDFKNIDLSDFSERKEWMKWGLVVLVAFIASEIVARILGVFIRPTYQPIPQKAPVAGVYSTPSEDYESIARRNMFNVEGKIPDPFDQGLLDCLSQARPSTQRMQLLGTIVMTNDSLSVALVQEDGNPLKIAVKKDELLFDKYVVMKVDRRKLCFQVRATQELEFIEIPDESQNLGVTAPSLSASGEGITPLSETDFSVKKTFLDEKLNNLNEILQTARAVPYIDGGKFKGFLIQSMDPTSPFNQLGLRTADILTSVNDIPMDNAGQGLVAFQQLRNSPKVALEIIRGGRKMTLNFNVQ